MLHPDEKSQKRPPTIAESEAAHYERKVNSGKIGPNRDHGVKSKAPGMDPDKQADANLANPNDAVDPELNADVPASKESKGKGKNKSAKSKKSE